MKISFTCSKEMGGIWIPVANGHIFLPIRCNRATHSEEVECEYLDIRSGNIIKKGHFQPKLTVNAKGWVQPNG